MKGSLTPMMRQYLDLKEKYSDCLLFFRLGDFYEMFFEDAETASRELEITLTGRDCGLEKKAPMCGVPHHSVDTYLNRLIERGYKVAICEQLTDPSESKGLVERDVIRIITPGTVIEEAILNENKNNYIGTVFLYEKKIGIAYCDVSTGAFTVNEFDSENAQTELMDELSRIQPSEIIVNDAVYLNELLAKRISTAYYMQCYDAVFSDKNAQKKLREHFNVNSSDELGMSAKPLAATAAGALLNYLYETQKNSLMHIKDITVINSSVYMHLDEATRRNLELTEPIRFDSSKKSTLLYLMNKTQTAMGTRLLREWIGHPLRNVESINFRLDAVEELVSKHTVREMLAIALKDIYDVERLCSKIAYGSINPKDCLSLKKTLASLPSVIQALSSVQSPALKEAYLNIDPMEDIYTLLESAIDDKAPMSAKDGEVIKAGYNSEVDKYRYVSENGREWIHQMEANEKAETGIKNLKISYNRIFGYYIEVTKSNIAQVPYRYQRRQTLANCERYTTPELKELEEQILGADEKCLSLEYKLFCEIRDMLKSCITRLQNNAKLLSRTDVLLSFAIVAFENNYCRPRMKKSGAIEITEGRHPVVEAVQKDTFIPNNTLLDMKENRVIILTGPNMAGKSTYMRQVALIVLMAHTGSFVPASCATIASCDRIFTRIGASDSLSTGQSTFMVEMNEVSNILNNATKNSLLILDEVGRGTSTFDGLSIAWAVLEHIAREDKCGAKTLFATHYHELTELEGKIAGIKNYRISVKEIGESIVFLRKIVRGGADKSFGIQVASLAGLPDEVIKRAGEILKELENADINHDISSIHTDGPQQMTLFGSVTPDDILTDLQSIEFDTLTPVEALNKLYDLHMRAKLRQR
ncbi:MAG: DNA mismatch repair protein MutS [Clostridia bacterium]|nr:DNA mismatch repair protein MutS [Clostridia bacterium]